MTDEVRAHRTDEPVDRMTRMCDAAIEAFAQHPEHQDGDKAIFFLDDGKHAGVVLQGYENDFDALTDLLIHLRAIFEANGKGFDIMFLDENGTTRMGLGRERHRE